MKHHLLTLSTVIISLITLITTTICYAAPISPAKSKEIASRFFASRHLGSQAKQVVPSATTRAFSDSQPYYIYNAGNDNGFVIVAGDDNMPTILGYSDEGNFSAEDIPDALKSLLVCYSKRYQVAGAVSKKIAKSATLEGEGTWTAVEPLVKTKWGQGYPYNNMCPTFFTGTKCYTGCVATAMAQILYYFYCTQPDKIDDALTDAIPAYDCLTTWNGYGSIHVDSILATNYINWKEMTNTYNSSSSTASKQAVSNLMIMCAASAQADFKQLSTSARVIASNFFNQYAEPIFPGANYALRKFFLLDNLSKSDFSDEELLTIIKDNLKDKRPLLLSGEDSIYGGHAFIVDGIDENQLVHVNWGWNGRYDGYFRIDSLATIEGNYSADKEVVYDFEPQGSGIRHAIETSISLPCFASSSIAIYDMTGRKVKTTDREQLAITLKRLPKGVYVAEDKKYVVR